MKVLKFAITAISLAVTSAISHAQEATVYGLIDVGIEYVSKAGIEGQSSIRMPSNTAGIAASRIGFRGSEDLGDGLKAMFTLEAGFGPDTGKSGQGGRLFGRQSFVGLSSSDFGQITFGRQYNATFYSLLHADVIGPSTFGLGSLDNYIPNTRSDNSIAYQKAFIDKKLLTVVTYSVGRDGANTGGPAATGCAGEVAGDSSACRQYTGLIKYDDANFGVALGYDRMNGGPGTVTGPLGSVFTSSSDSDTRIIANGYYKFGNVKVAGGWINRKIDPTAQSVGGRTDDIKSDLMFFGVNYIPSPSYTFDALYAHLDVDKGYGSAKAKSNLFTVRAMYNFSKTFGIYAQAAHLSNNDAAAVGLSGGQPYGVKAGADQTGLIIGMRKSF